MRHGWMLAAAGTVVLVMSGVAPAATYQWNFPLDGLQEVPPNASPGTASGMVDYDDVSNQLDWDFAWSGLLAPVTAMHFHGPAAPGANAGVQVNIGAISGLTSPSIGLTTITDAQEADLLQELWYVNIHTNVFPGGEIRGQVVPEPASLAFLVVAGVLLLARRRRSR